jgi:hypothetical protein
MIWRCDLKEPCVKFCESNEKGKCGIRRRDMIKQNHIQIGKEYFNGNDIVTVCSIFSRWEKDVVQHPLVNYVFMKTEMDILLVRTQEEFIREFSLEIPQRTPTIYKGNG